MRRKENGMFTRVLSILLTSPSTTFRSRRRRMGTREVRTVSEEWKEWRTERTERVPLPTSLRSSRRLLTFPPHPTAARPERNVVKWRGVRDEWREWGTNGRSEEWTTLSAAVGLWGSVRPSRLRLLSPHFTRRGETGSAGYGKWSESWTERKERQTRNRRSEVNGRRGYEPTWTERVIRSERVTWGGETRDVRNERRTACLTSLSIPSRRSHVPVTSLRVANRPPAGMVIRRE